MHKIASQFFTLSILIYYILKIFKVKRKTCINVHAALGSISIAAMIITLFSKIGEGDFLKYLGFSTIMITIGLSGYFMKKNYKINKIIHIAGTLSFFVYLFVVVKFFR